MKREEVKRKSIKGIKTVIYGRTVIVVLAFLIQLALIVCSFLWLRNYSIFVYALFGLIGVIVLLHLFNAKGAPDIKLCWMLPIVIFPVFGALFYVFITTQGGAHYLQKRLAVLSGHTGKYIAQNAEAVEKLAAENGQAERFADYLMKYDNSPVYIHTQLKFYPLGDDWFPDMLEELKKAEKFIFLEYFIVEEGCVWNPVLDILKEKVKQGVEVRFMYDGMCSLSLLPNFYPKLMEKEGIRCKMFSPIRPVFSSHYNNRDHRKILVIDGKVAFTGGTNLADEYINQKVRFGHWKDTAVRLKGDAVERFTCMFLEMWNVSERGEEEYDRYRTPAGAAMAEDGYVIPYSVTPYGTERMGKRVYLDVLNTARKYVHIMTPYLIPDYEMMMALTYAARRGVEIVIIMPHIPDKKYAFVVAKTYYNELLEAGVKIYEYTPGFVHAKIFVSDDEKAVVGTVNLDYRSLYHHFECGVYLYRNSEIAAIEADFDSTLKQCMEADKTAYQRQKLWERLEGKLLRMFAPLM